MFDVDLPSLEELFDKAEAMGCVMYNVTTIDAVHGGEIDTSQEPNPEKTPIAWASRSEVVEIDHEGQTATVKVWF